MNACFRSAKYLTPRKTFFLGRFKSNKAVLSEPFREAEISVIRKWLSSFTCESIPRRICEVSFSRSSGPGGQNVNKVNSKATLRVDLDSLLPTIPSSLHAVIRTSDFVKKSDKIIIQSDGSRKQSENLETCFTKLHELIHKVVKDIVPGETSVGQSERVKHLQKADNQARLRMKKSQSIKKKARQNRSKSDY